MADGSTGTTPAWGAAKGAAKGAATASANGVAYEFPGCRPIRISRTEITDFDGRYEYWEADTEIAWQVAEPTSPYHELPSQRLARLSDRIAAVRGSPIETFGTADLLVRDEDSAAGTAFCRPTRSCTCIRGAPGRLATRWKSQMKICRTSLSKWI